MAPSSKRSLSTKVQPSTLATKTPTTAPQPAVRRVASTSPSPVSKKRKAVVPVRSPPKTDKVPGVVLRIGLSGEVEVLRKLGKLPQSLSISTRKVKPTSARNTAVTASTARKGSSSSDSSRR
ncbi:hypothetical protein HKX48_006417 [Thoreauomyces humboldtii]|nr:hypothetical protein HKX48_006417 [Thoreauomyces humboldtii]